MEKLNNYKKIVEKILSEKLRFPTSNYPYLKDILVIDKTRNHFMVITFVWDKEEYINSTTYHIEVNDNEKVLIHENRTDIQLDELLLENNIANEDLLDGMEETFPRKVDSKAA